VVSVPATKPIVSVLAEAAGAVAAPVADAVTAVPAVACLPATKAAALTAAARLTPTSPLPENVTSEWATPAASIKEVVVRRMLSC